MEATSITDAIQVILCLNKCLCPKLGPYSERVHFSGYCPGSPHPQCSQVSTAIPGDALLKPSFFLVFSVASCLQMASLKNSTVESSKPSPPKKKKKNLKEQRPPWCCACLQMCFPRLGTGSSWFFHGCTDYFPLLRIKVASVGFLTPELTLFHLMDCGAHEKSLSFLENEVWRAWECWSSSCTLCPLSSSYLACHSDTVLGPIGVHSLQPLQ